MNIEKLEALVSVMTKDQFSKFETAVLNLLKEKNLFTSGELSILEKKVQNLKQLEREQLLIVNN